MTGAARAREVAQRFAIPGDLIAAQRYGNGHINDTFRLTYERAGARARYLLQRINTRVFTRPDLLMENIERVTAFQRDQLAEAGAVDAERRSLTLIPTHEGQFAVVDADGGWWRCYRFIEAAQAPEVVTAPDQAREAARMFGEFQALLARMPADRLHETIPDFHHTGRRFEALQAAARADVAGRAREVADLIDFASEREDLAWSVVALLDDGSIPERVTHNDTKVNNVLLDDSSGRGLCVLDLDTVMPGSVLYDFGELVRTATASVAEDSTELDRMHCRLDLFEALTQGYLASAGRFLTAGEIAALPASGRLMAFENGMRFLTDYLSGDTYYATSRPRHNLDRARAQFALVGSIEEQMPRLEEIVARGVVR